MDRLVGPLSSVVCSLDIVKRVVTVKPVQPFRLGWTGAWVCEEYAGARSSRRSEGLCLGSRAQVTRAQKVKIGVGRVCPVCPLIAVL